MTLLKTTLAAVACCLPLWTATAGPLDDENARLRAQVEQLKAQLQAAQTSCYASGSAASATSPVAPAGAKPSLSAAPDTPASASPAPVAGATSVSVATPAAPKNEGPTTEVPTGYKLVKIEPVVPADNRWKDANAWDSLTRGMSKKDVEDLLGVEHSTTDGNGRTFWGYGKIGVQYSGKVIFVDDRLAVWTKPDF